MTDRLADLMAEYGKFLPASELGCDLEQMETGLQVTEDDGDGLQVKQAEVTGQSAS